MDDCAGEPPGGGWCQQTCRFLLLAVASSYNLGGLMPTGMHSLSAGQIPPPGTFTLNIGTDNLNGRYHTK